MRCDVIFGSSRGCRPGMVERLELVRTEVKKLLTGVECVKEAFRR